jgi:crotonobetainyl-CoA:carnitine CoA-transferase CaiB-like acyl-CoA transferase
VAEGASAARLVHRVWAELGRDAAELEPIMPVGSLPEVPLPARLDVSGLAAGSVAAASAVAAALVGTGDRVRVSRAAPQIAIDGARIATAFTSERWFRIDGLTHDPWAPLSGFRRAADGWVRTHANYPWHAAALRRALGAADDASVETVDAAIAERRAADLELAVAREGGLCVAVRAENAVDDADRRRHPLVELRPAGAGSRPPLVAADPARPLAGVRVLDLTRVIAGPVGTRSLAGLGADVLRIDPPARPEPSWQHLDTGAGKRSALLDLGAAADRARFDELLQTADAVVLGYRPAALDELGLGAEELADSHPRLVVAQLSVWGFEGEAAHRRGFDSIVQAASGVALVEGADDRPGALPAQALDHATGYLLAAAVISMLAAGGAGERIARLSLRRTAAELLGMPRTVEQSPSGPLDEPAAVAHLQRLESGGRELRVTRPAIAVNGLAGTWTEAPRAWGADEPRWPE